MQAFVFATFSTLLTFVLELYLHRHFNKRLALATSQLQDQSEACAEQGCAGPASHHGTHLCSHACRCLMGAPFAAWQLPTAIVCMLPGCFSPAAAQQTKRLKILCSVQV